MQNFLKILLSALFVIIIGGCASKGRLFDPVVSSSYDLYQPEGLDKLLNEHGNTPSSPQALTWRAATESANNSVIKVGDNEYLKPKAVDIEVQIDGFRARVVVDGFYYNPHYANLEGAFKYRLPTGARPYFLAFGETFSQTIDHKRDYFENIFDERRGKRIDLGPKSLVLAREGKWKEPKQAIMVSRAKAALAYTTIVARQVDPALLEWSGSGVFSTKVFPLQPRKLHRVVIGYDVDLLSIGNDLVFDLPINGFNAEKRIHINVATAATAAAPSFHKVINHQVQLPLSHDGYDGATEHQQTFVGTDLDGVRVVIPSAASFVLTGEDTVDRYFAMRSKIHLPEFSLASNSRAVFALDASWSAAPEKFQSWVDLLLATLENNEQHIKQFAVMTFSIDHHWWQPKFMANTKANRYALLTYLNQTVLEGATDINNALLNAGNPSWMMPKDSTKNDYDLFLYSDGAATWGESEAYLLSENLKKLFSGRLFAYRFNFLSENAELLNHLTREFSGASYQLTENNDISLLSIAHNSRAWKIESVSLAGTDDIVIEGRPSTVYPGQQLKIAGRIKTEIDSPLTIKLSLGDRKEVIELQTQELVESDLTSRVYGQIAVNQLESLGHLEAELASAYANHFLVPGVSSSLLMLETEEDYRQHNIVPGEDASVVATKTVTGTLQKLSADFKTALIDQKKRFLQQLTKLEQIQNIDFALPNAVSVLLDDMPASAFEVELSGLKTSRLEKQDLPEYYLAKLGENSQVYDIIETEARARFKKLSAADALKVMSSLVEIAPGDPVILREVAYAAQEWEMHAAAFKLHQKVAKVRPYEPQTYTDLAKLADHLGRPDLALLYYEIGLASHWTGRFGDFHLIHKIDYLNFLRKNQDDQLDFYSKSYAKLKVDSLLNELKLEKSNIIISASWNTDRTDVGLYVIEPTGERCYYRNTNTRTGGYITKNVTTGYGPEMYLNPKARRGSYKVYAKYYSSDRNSLGLKTKLRVRIVKYWGTKRQVEKTMVVALEDNREMHRVAKVRL